MQISCNAYIGVLYSTVDTFGPNAYSSLCAFLNILRERLRKLGPSLNNDSNGPHNAQSHTQQLRSCIRYHQLCLELGHCLDQLLAVHYGVQFVASAIVLCVTAFMLSSVERPGADVARFAFLLMYMVNMGLELIIPCWWGSQVMAASGRLSQAVFESGWWRVAAVGGGVEQQARFARLMRVFVERVRRPLVAYTWQKVFVIALPTFVTVGRAAYSLLSCLKGL